MNRFDHHHHHHHHPHHHPHHHHHHARRWENQNENKKMCFLKIRGGFDRSEMEMLSASYDFGVGIVAFPIKTSAVRRVETNPRLHLHCGCGSGLRPKSGKIRLTQQEAYHACNKHMFHSAIAFLSLFCGMLGKLHARRSNLSPIDRNVAVFAGYWSWRQSPIQVQSMV
jgi:hypothetical protein